MPSMIESVARKVVADPSPANIELLRKAVSDADTTEDALAYREAADAQYGCDGEIEIDDDAVVSLSDDGGAYVAAWLWVSEDEITKETES